MTTIRPFTFDVRGALFVIAVLTLLSPAHAWETHSGAHDEAGVTSEPRRWIGRASLGATYLEASTDVFASRGVGVAMGGDITTRIAREVYAGGALAFGTTLATTRAGSVAALEHAELRAYSLGPTLSYYLAGDRGAARAGIRRGARFFGAGRRRRRDHRLGAQPGRNRGLRLRSRADYHGRCRAPHRVGQRLESGRPRRGGGAVPGGHRHVRDRRSPLSQRRYFAWCGWMTTDSMVEFEHHS